MESEAREKGMHSPRTNSSVGVEVALAVERLTCHSSASRALSLDGSEKNGCKRTSGSSGERGGEGGAGEAPHEPAVGNLATSA